MTPETALSLPQRAAVALGAAEHEVKLRELVKSSADITAVIDAPGRDQAHRIAMTLKNARVAIEKASKTAREDAVAFGKAVIAEEKRLVDIVTGEETRVFALRDDWDAKVEAERQAKIAAERARIEAIARAIDDIRSDETQALRVDRSVEQTLATLVNCEARDLMKSVFQERFDEAVEIHAAVLVSIRAVLAEREAAEKAAAEAEAARRAEVARIEAERAALAAQRAENERIANEQAKERQRLADLQAAQEAAAKELADRAAANLKAERDALEERMRLEREEQSRVAAETKRQLEAQAAQLAAERKALDDERLAAEQAKVDATNTAAQQEVNAALDRADAEDAARFAPPPALELLTDDVPDGPTDEEVIEVVAETFGMTTLEAIDRLARVDLAGARLMLEVAA